MARAYLSGPAMATSTADHYQVTVHVAHDALQANNGQSEMPIVEGDQGGQPMNVGRKRRIVPTANRRALWSRDRATGGMRICKTMHRA